MLEHDRAVRGDPAYEPLRTKDSYLPLHLISEIKTSTISTFPTLCAATPSPMSLFISICFHFFCFVFLVFFCLHRTPAANPAGIHGHIFEVFCRTEFRQHQRVIFSGVIPRYEKGETQSWRKEWTDVDEQNERCNITDARIPFKSAKYPGEIGDDILRIWARPHDGGKREQRSLFERVHGMKRTTEAGAIKSTTVVRFKSPLPPCFPQ